MKKIEYVYYNSYLLGTIKDHHCESFDDSKKQQFMKDLQNRIIKSEHRRKLCSLLIGGSMLIIAFTLAMLMLLKVITLGSSQWFNYTFVLVLLVFLWVAFYYLFGLIFYPSIKMTIHFKNPKDQSCLNYASSNYCKYVNLHSSYVGKTNFNIKDDKGKLHPVPFALKTPSVMKNIIFNGHIKCNIPYFYLIQGAKRILFLPGLVIIVNGKHSKVIPSKDFKVKITNNHYDLYILNNLILSFNCNGEFNGNFFYFKYEQF